MTAEVLIGSITEVGLIVLDPLREGFLEDLLEALVVVRAMIVDAMAEENPIHQIEESNDENGVVKGLFTETCGEDLVDIGLDQSRGMKGEGADVAKEGFEVVGEGAGIDVFDEGVEEVNVDAVAGAVDAMSLKTEPAVIEGGDVGGDQLAGAHREFTGAAEELVVKQEEAVDAAGKASKDFEKAVIGGEGRKESHESVSREEEQRGASGRNCVLTSVDVTTQVVKRSIKRWLGRLGRM